MKVFTVAEANNLLIEIVPKLKAIKQHYAQIAAMRESARAAAGASEFGGGMPGGVNMRGGPGMHFYSNFGGAGMRGAQFGRRPGQQQEARPTEQATGLGNIMQFLPFLLILVLSFFNSTGNSGHSASYSAGENKYFSLTVR